MPRAMTGAPGPGFDEQVIRATDNQVFVSALLRAAPMWLIALAVLLGRSSSAVAWSLFTACFFLGGVFAVVERRRARQRTVAYGPAGVWTGSAAVPWDRIADVAAIERLGLRSIQLRLTATQPPSRERVRLQLPPGWASDAAAREALVTAIRERAAGA